MIFDVEKLTNREISIAAEKNMPTSEEWTKRLGLAREEIVPMGRLARLNYHRIISRIGKNSNGKYVNISGMTPTRFGEGKTTTAIGLMQGLNSLGKNVGGCLRQASSGPTMNMKGTSVGAGNALLIPMEELSMGLTGDLDRLTHAHNLGMVALTARLQHECNYSDKELLRRSGQPRLNIDVKRIEFKWVIDLCAQALRKVELEMKGLRVDSGFEISPSSELMSILSISTSLGDLRKRIGNITLAYGKNGKPITTSDLQVDGAMCAWMLNTINPTLCCTSDYLPCLIHSGPFANIALGQSSVIGDILGLKLFDYHVTESGFGSEIGFEKFWNVKSRLSGLQPDACVLTATIRALKEHGEETLTKQGISGPKKQKNRDLTLIEQGLPNLLHHVAIIRKSGLDPVVCLNRFFSDTEEEIKFFRRTLKSYGISCAVSNHWARGGEGATEFAEKVVSATERKSAFKFLYPRSQKIRSKIKTIATQIYGAKGVKFSSKALARLSQLESNRAFEDFELVMVKTPLSLSDDKDYDYQIKCVL